MSFHFLRSAAKVFTGAVLFTIIFSLIYNQPIRFRPKMDIYARSVYSPYPSKGSPDQIILNQAEDSDTAVSLNWRTSASVTSGEVRYWAADEGSDRRYMLEKAELKTLESRELRKDRLTHHFSATLKNLKPGVSYQYTVGDPSGENRSAARSFTMPAKDDGSFSFIHFGDTQGSTVFFGNRLEDLINRYPETAFYMMSGDLVDDGDWRHQWDAFLLAASDVFSQRPVAVALGNHDYSQGKGYGLDYIRAFFNLPDNGPDDQPGSYSFRHKNVHFIVMDSNQDAAEQAGWLEERLKVAAGADFRVIMFHHPPYNQKERERRQANVAKHWTPLFDAYRVDLVLNGHEHIYMRTKKIQNDKVVRDDEDGVTYVIATVSKRLNRQEESEYAMKQVDNIGTYQLVAVEYDRAGKASLHYKAYDFQHRLIDEFILNKRAR